MIKSAVRCFKKQVLMQYDDQLLEALFSGTFLEQLSSFQVYYSSFVLAIYGAVNLVLIEYGKSQDDEVRNFNLKQVIYVCLLAFSFVVFIAGYKSPSCRTYLISLQYALFIGLHTALMINQSVSSDKLLTLLACVSLHFCLMPQNRQVFILISSIASFALLNISYHTSDWQDLWQIWVLFGYLGVELRFLIDEKQKRLLFYNEDRGGYSKLWADIDQLNQKQGSSKETDVLKIAKMQSSPSSLPSKLGVFIPSADHPKNFTNHAGRIQNQITTQAQQVSEKKILFSPPMSPDSSFQLRNGQGRTFSFFQNNNANGNNNEQSPFKERQSSIIATNLRKRASVFQMQKGVEDLRNVLLGGAQFSNNNSQDPGFRMRIDSNAQMGNSRRQSSSPLFGHPPFEIQQTLALANNPQSSILESLPFSTILGNFDPSYSESLQLIEANEKARTTYGITDSQKMDEFLTKCKVTALISNIPFDKSDNSLKRMLLTRYQLSANDKQSALSFLSPEKRQLFFNTNIASSSPSNYKTPTLSNIGNQKHFFWQSPENIRKLEDNQPNGPESNANFNTQKRQWYEMMVEINGRKQQQWIAKVLVINETFLVLINDDSIEKYILDQSKRRTCLRLLDQIDCITKRVDNLQMELSKGQINRREIFNQNLLLVNYLVNLNVDIKETLEVKLETKQKRFDLLQLLVNTSEMIRKESKKNQVKLLINSNIPSHNIYTDQYYLAHTLTNLLENAYNHTHSGFVQILVHQSRIFQGNIRFDIVDSGTGLDENTLKFLNQSNQQDGNNDPSLSQMLQRYNNPTNKTGSNNPSNINNPECVWADSEEITGFGLKFSLHLIKILGPYNRIFAETVPGIGSRVSFVVYKEGIPSQDSEFKPYQFKNDNFEREMEYFNPISEFSEEYDQTGSYSQSADSEKNCQLSEYIQFVQRQLKDNKDKKYSQNVKKKDNKSNRVILGDNGITEQIKKEPLDTEQLEFILGESSLDPPAVNRPAVNVYTPNIAAKALQEKQQKVLQNQNNQDQQQKQQQVLIQTQIPLPIVDSTASPLKFTISNNTNQQRQLLLKESYPKQQHASQYSDQIYSPSNILSNASPPSSPFQFPPFLPSNYQSDELPLHAESIFRLDSGISTSSKSKQGENMTQNQINIEPVGQDIYQQQISNEKKLDEQGLMKQEKQFKDILQTAVGNNNLLQNNKNNNSNIINNQNNNDYLSDPQQTALQEHISFTIPLSSNRREPLVNTYSVSELIYEKKAQDLSISRGPNAFY